MKLFLLLGVVSIIGCDDNPHMTDLTGKKHYIDTWKQNCANGLEAAKTQTDTMLVIKTNPGCAYLLGDH